MKKLSILLGKELARIGLSPNQLTLLGLILAIFVPVATYYKQVPAAILLIGLSAFIDFLDGALAKATGLSSRVGSFLDSVCDRVADAAYLISLFILGVNGYLIIIGLTASFLISYTRAKGESLDIKMEGVGLMERGDRIIFVILILVVSSYINLTWGNYLFIVFTLLSIITVLHRSLHIIRGLKNGL